jgi:Na+:H+ antiporter, NhaA family
MPKGAAYNAPLEKIYTRLLSPIEHFIHAQTSGGIVLMVSVAVAMTLANSALHNEYEHFIHIPIGLSVGGFELSHSLGHWINDGLMAIFFLVVGLEIKREVMVGELSSVKKAALPVIAAYGGMLVPALFYLTLNWSGASSRGWGIPMATDIAFAVGVLVLLGKRAPSSVMTFLLALAIADDLGAVLVIGIFYTETLFLNYLLAAAALLAVLLLMNLLGVRAVLPYLLIGLGVWLAMLKSGVHATLAGVLVAITIPVRPKYEPAVFSETIRALIDRFDALREERTFSSWSAFASQEQAKVIEDIEMSADRAASPLRKLETNLHGFSAFFIVPVFALANSGVQLDWRNLGAALLDPITLGIMLGLVAGKCVGIFGFSFVAIKFGFGNLPVGATMRHLFGVSILGGIGFTMSIFVAELAFKNHDAEIAAAKTGILFASLLAGLLGYFFLRTLPPVRESDQVL